MHELLHTPLSERELEILRLVAQGKSNKEIASELFISVNTVKVHLAKIFQRIGVASRTEATFKAIEHGLIINPGKALGSTEAQTNLDENKPVRITQQKGVQQISIRYLYLILLVIILLLAISVLTLLQRNQPAQVINAQSNWQRLSDLPSIHHEPAVAVMDSLIYVIGGKTQAGLSAQTDLFNPKLNTWETLVDKPTPVSQAKAAVVGRRIYVPGGRLADGLATDVMEVFDCTTSTWHKKANLPQPLYNYGLTVFENKILLFGGQNEQLVSTVVYIYNPNADEWTEETSLISQAALAMGIISLKGKLFLFGGSDGKQDFDTVITYKPLSNDDTQTSWENVATIPKDAKPDTAQLAGDFIFLLGKNGVWQFIPQDEKWILQPYQNGRLDISDNSVVSSEGYLFRFGGYDSKGDYSAEFFRYQVIYSVVLPNIYR